MGVTSFTDLTESEFLSQYTMPSSSLPARRNSTESKVNSKFLKQSGSINWVAQGMTPPVLNQGSCNAGYAFATVEAVESAYAIIRNVNVSLSVEQVVQCSQSYQNNGCTGGQVQHSLEYVQNNGLCTSTQYPWVSGNGQTGSCNTNLAQSCKTQYTITGDNSIDGCENLSQYLQDQPITACLESSPSLQNYNGGVFDGSDCTTGQNVQCMLAVGIVNGDWYLQNSWGTTWGDQGYIYVASGNTCAVCNFNQQAELNRN